MELNRDILRKLPLALRIEIEENAQRKRLAQSELAAEQKRILDELRKHKAPGTRTDLKGCKTTSEKTFSQVRATGVVGKLFNESHKQVEKRLAVVAAADAEPRYGKLVEYMDETGRVDLAFKQLQNARHQEEHARRVEHGCTVDDLVVLAESGRRFPVIYADPPWQWQTWGGPSGKIHSAVDNHYGTSPIDEIAKLPVAPLAADDCVLLLWCTWPHIAIGTHVAIIEAWGFRPSTAAFVWIKQISETNDKLATGMGYWTRSNSEVCLLATKGSPTRLATDVHQVVSAPVGEHSAKPEEARRRIERLFAGPYLELYGRQPVPSWTVWGDEIAAEVAS